jgi:hypothetical protein
VRGKRMNLKKMKEENLNDLQKMVLYVYSGKYGEIYL